ncbi:hypothetical protein SAMN04490248_11021 [Salinihabitans flavidus]|uniref:Sulfotransferase family protein n=1 Tax=Salinihabitans flavidus TaxID=569882 RepID=A0A1H8RXQ3_9RHOB|nr:hypothetical protein [Salinihabitans flavidus]SEO70918.1 hypothetical protein SAMN04490248_11021 [Salinihabitans flavidus]
MTGPIVVHAGFHKTGTTTVQATLRANRTALLPHLAIWMRPRLRPTVLAARGFSTWRDAPSRAKLAIRLTELTETLPGLKSRGLILSAEELSGHMPGRPGIDDYSAVPILMSEIAGALQNRFPLSDLHIVFTTRAAADWLPSSYWEHVKSSSLTESYEAFAARLPRAADFAPVVEKTARAVAPASVHALPPTSDHPLGHAGDILRFFDLPAGLELQAVPPANTRPPQPVLDQLLTINRTVHDPAARRDAKRALLSGSPSALPQNRLGERP